MSEVGRFRRLYASDLLDPQVQNLSLIEFKVFVHAYAGPQVTSAGCFVFSPALAIEEIGNVSAKEFSKAFDAVRLTLGWQYDAATRVLWIPSFLEKNPPQSVNVVKSWRRLLGDVPDCAVKRDAVDNIHLYLQALKVDKAEAFRLSFGSYRVSLPAGFVENQTIQGAGRLIRDQGTRRRAGARDGEGTYGNALDDGLVQITKERVELNFGTETTEDEEIEQIQNAARRRCGTSFTTSQVKRALRQVKAQVCTA